MIGFLALLTITLAAADVQIAQCAFGPEAFLGFVGTVTLNIDITAQALTLSGTVNNNLAKKWIPNDNHDVQIREFNDVSASCANVGDVFVDLLDYQTDANANLVFDNKGPVDFSAKVNKLKDLVGRSLVIQRNNSNVVANAVVACCAIIDPTGAITTYYTAPVATKATPAPEPTVASGAWPYNFPNGWIAPPGCQYVPAGYDDYVKTTTTTTTTAYYVATTTKPPPPPPTTVKYDPYAPPPPPPPPPPAPYYAPPPPPPPTTVYYDTTKATTTAPQYCWNCPPYAYGAAPPASAYYLVPCPPPTQAPCIPSYTQRCSASNVVLGLLAAVVAILALLI